MSPFVCVAALMPAPCQLGLSGSLPGSLQSAQSVWGRASAEGRARELPGRPARGSPCGAPWGPLLCCPGPIIPTWPRLSQASD